MEKGTSAKRHPWYLQKAQPKLLLATLLSRYGDQLQKRVTTTKNFGLLGGWLRCEFWCVQGEPTGVTSSTWIGQTL